MNMQFFKISLILMLVLVFVACESEKEKHSGQVDSLSTDQKDSLAVKKITPELKEAPDWFEELPVEEGFLYAAATAISRSPGLAMDKAKMKAQRELARQVTTINVSENSSSGGGSDETSETFEATLKNVKVKKQKQLKEGNYWRVYILMEIKVRENS